MDVMSLRRGLMAQMACGSVLEQLLEVADTFEPTVETNEHSFYYGGVLGGYFLVSSPLGLPKNKDVPQFTGDNNYISSVPFYIHRWSGAYAYGNLTAVTIRREYESRGYYDYWGCQGSTIDDTHVNIVLSGSIKYKVGVKYYLLRLKQ